MSGNVAAILVVLMLAALITAARTGILGENVAPAPPPAMSANPTLELRLDAGGCGIVNVEGRNIAGLTRGVTVRTHAGEPSHVDIELIPLTGIDLVLDEAIIETHRQHERAAPPRILEGPLVDLEHVEALRRFWSYPCSFGFEYTGDITERRMREVLGMPEHFDLHDTIGSPGWRDEEPER